MYNSYGQAFTANAQVAAVASAAAAAEQSEVKQKDGLAVICGDRMGLEQKLATNIEEDYYFTGTLCKMNTFEQLCEEAKQEGCKHVYAWGGMRGDYRRADNIVLGGKTCENNVHVNRSPARLWCILYRMFTLRLSEAQLKYLLENNSKIQHRSLGVLYVRFTQPHEDHLQWVKHLFRGSDDVVQVCPAGQRTGTSTTICNFARNVFLEMKYLGTQFPRIPVKYVKAIKEYITEIDEVCGYFCFHSHSHSHSHSVIRSRTETGNKTLQGETMGTSRGRERNVPAKKAEEKDKERERLREKRGGEDPPRRKRRGRLGLDDFPSTSIRTDERERLDERSADRRQQLDRLVSGGAYKSRREEETRSRSSTPPPSREPKKTEPDAPATRYEAVKRAALQKTYVYFLEM